MRIVLLFFTALFALPLAAQEIGAAQQLRKLMQVYRYLDGLYVDEVEMGPLVESAIEGMLEELDPHSAYIGAEDMKGVQESFDGEFSGIGIEFNVLRDTVIVVNTIVGGPAERVGVFDVANPSAQAQRQFYRFLRRVTEQNPGLQIILIAGNHDSASRLETPIPLLEEMNIQIRGTVRKRADGTIDTEELIIELKDRSGKRQGWCLAVPYLRQGDYPAVESEGDPYQAGVKAMYDKLVACVEERRQKQEAIIAMGHLQAAGSQISEGDQSERLIIGGLEGIPSSVFPSQITYGALGHIHREQQIANRNEIRYAGSPLPMSFAEENYRHGVILLEIDKGILLNQTKIIFNPLVTLLRIPKHPAPLDEVLNRLSQLPEERDDHPAPFLEVRVLLTEPEPALRNKVEEALRTKQVRLTRVLPFYPDTVQLTKNENTLTTEELLDPWKLLNRVYERRYQNPLPEELAHLFREVIEESQLKMGEKQ